MTNAYVAAARAIEMIDDEFVGDAWEHGSDAMRWSPALEREQPAELRIGDVVDYHGSMATEYGEYIVAGIDPDDDRLALRHHYYPEFNLARVRRASVTPTGQRVSICVACRHPQAHPQRVTNGACPRIGCGCPHHR